MDRFSNVLDSKLMKSNIIDRLESIQAEPTPKQLAQSQIENVLQRFDNIDNLMQHLMHDMIVRQGKTRIISFIRFRNAKSTYSIHKGFQR